jgi:adenosylcobinamide-GDP ribazoletransferase
MRKILLAFQFLTIIPVKEMKDVSEKEIGGASVFFPLIGFIQGALFVVSAVLFLKIFPPELANGLLILVIAATSGGLHLDGLADTFDAIALRGDREKKLLVMKDSTIGPVGVIAIVLALLLKFLALNSLFSYSLFTFYYSLFLMPVFSRWVMVTAIFHGKSARQDGIGKIFIENTKLKELVIATLLAIGCWLLVVSFLLSSLFTIHYSLFLVSIPVLYIFSLISVWFCNKKFGGMTGDTFGAVSEISEILFLIMAVIIRNSSI